MLNLIRISKSPFSTRGVFVFNGIPLCYTLELPWNENAQSISCIPEGAYDVHKSTSQKFGQVFRFAYVRGRSGILIHSGNTIRDTTGCILPGLDANSNGVLSSKLALNRLLNTLPENFKLLISEA